MLEALIIRADGAIADIEDLRYQVFAQVFEEAGFEWRFDKAQFFDSVRFTACGERMTHLLKQSVRWRADTPDMSPLISAMQRRAQHLLVAKLKDAASLETRAGVAELVRAARREDIKVAVVGALRDEGLCTLLSRTLGTGALDLVDSRCCCTDEAANAQRFYQRAADALAVPCGNCLVIEGTISGAKAARAAGFKALTTRAGSCGESCGDDGDLVVIEDLPSLIANSDKRRLDPLTADERAELILALQRLHAGTFDAAKINRSSAMRVSDILKSKGSAVKTIDPSASIRALARALRTESVGVMVVVDGKGGLKGIISERDLARGLADFGNDLSTMLVSHLMTTTVVTCTPDDAVANVARIMTQRRIRHLPVMTGAKIAGLISIGDVLKYRLDEVQLEANVLRDVAIARG